jgi:beta-keto acid cleavage enzyme
VEEQSGREFRPTEFKHRRLSSSKRLVGPGGRFVPSPDDPKVFGPGTTLMNPGQRVEHIAALKPDICTLDLNTRSSGAQVVINTPGNVRRMAKVIRQSGVKPEIELFDSGDIALLNDLVNDGTLDPAPLCSIVMGVKYGFRPSAETVLYARSLLPQGSLWTAFGIGRTAFAMAAQSVVAAAMFGSALKTRSIFREESLLRPTLLWWQKRATLAKRSASRSLRRKGRERS